MYRHKRITAINVAGLGIGMAATILIALWVQNELNFDSYHPSSENIYRTKTTFTTALHEQQVWENSQYILGEFAVKQIPEIELLTRLQPRGYNPLIFRLDGKLITEKKSAYVDQQWFNMFHYDFVEGSPENFLINPFSLILTESTAKKYFGKEDAVGKVLRVDTVNYVVQAIVKDNPTNSSFQYNILLPLSSQFTNPKKKESAMQWGNYGYLTFIKLKPGSNTAKVGDRLSQIVDQNRKNVTKSVYSLIKLADIHFESDLPNSSFIHGSRITVNVFSILALLLLATACINYVNLTTARASIRSKEVSVRKIVGANRSHLFGQFMSESILVSIIAGILALLLVQVTITWFRVFTDKNFTDPFSNPIVWLIIGATLVVSFVLNGLYPALLLSSFQPLNVFRGKAILNFKDAGFRKTLVVVQFVISVVLIISTMVIYLQLRYMQKINVWYSKEQIFTFRLPWQVLGGRDDKEHERIVNTICQQLKQYSAVSDVTVANEAIVNFSNTSAGGFDWPGRPKDFNPPLSPLQVGQNFLDMMHLKVKEGRWFNTQRADQHNVLINETAVGVLNLRQPVIGQLFMHQGDTGVIIGILKDFHYRSLHEKIGPMVIAEEPSEPATFYVKTRPENTQSALAIAQRIWKERDPNEPFDANFLDESYASLYKTEERSSVLITLFAGVAILVSALGLLGLAAFAAEQKVKEIGIRKVLGAGVSHIVSLLSADFLKMVLIAGVIAFPIAWWAMNKWLQGFAYKINLSWWIFLAAAGIALLIALITVGFQAIKAAIANPVDSLRSE
jgi:putative ABC transport system permease protein